MGDTSCADRVPSSHETHPERGEEPGQKPAWPCALRGALTGVLGRCLGGGEITLSMEYMGRILMCHQG